MYRSTGVGRAETLACFCGAAARVTDKWSRTKGPVGLVGQATGDPHTPACGRESVFSCVSRRTGRWSPPAAAPRTSRQAAHARPASTGTPLVAAAPCRRGLRSLSPSLPLSLSISNALCADPQAAPTFRLGRRRRCRASTTGTRTSSASSSSTSRCVCVCVCVRACARARVRSFACMCVRACVRVVVAVCLCERARGCGGVFVRGCG